MYEQVSAQATASKLASSLQNSTPHTAAPPAGTSVVLPPRRVRSCHSRTTPLSAPDAVQLGCSGEWATLHTLQQSMHAGSAYQACQRSVESRLAIVENSQEPASWQEFKQTKANDLKETHRRPLCSSASVSQ